MKIIPWLQLLRFPNIFTVPGDVLMGAFLVHQAGHRMHAVPLSLALVATCFFYFGGMVLNDIIDAVEDAAERPNRPIPAGHISNAQAVTVALCLFGMALACAYFAGLAVWASALSLFVFILLYDLGMKKIPVLGPAFMGLCRATAIIIGAAACGENFRLSWSTFILAETYLLYFSLITILARYETRPQLPRVLTPLPIIMLLNGLLLLLNFNDNKTQLDLLLYIALSCVAVGQGIEISRQLFIRRKVLPQQIGSLIHLILWVQAAVICYAGQGAVALIILCFIPVSRIVRRYIYAS